MSGARPSYKKLQAAIAKGDGRNIESRWAYGVAVLGDRRKMSSTGDQLRAGAIEALIADAKAVGSKLTESEIRRRLRCARAYRSLDAIRSAATVYATWWDLVEAGFPLVDVDEEDLLTALAEAQEEPDWEQPVLIPGLKHELKINKQKIPLAQALVADGDAYEQMCIDMHEGFGKTVEQVRETMRIARLGAKGDRGMRLVEAYERGLAGHEDEPVTEEEDQPPP